MNGSRILLVIGGGIAAYKSCELVRLIRKAGGTVTCVLTEGGAQFVTPMALAALSENKVYTSLFDLKDEVEMGHIQLSREADLVVVCPATANMMAKMAAGIADDLATTLILATDKPVLAVPAMNVRMWEHEATQRNARWLRQAGVGVMEPDEGPMACGEFGPGRLPEPPAILREIARALDLDLPAEDAPIAPGRAGERDPVDDEGEQGFAKGGLGSLLSAIIPRSTVRRSHDELEEEYDALPDLDAEDLSYPDSTMDEMPPPAGPLLATKGKAGAAPPTDPEAINHEVAKRDPLARPQPFDPLSVDPSAINPLDGQGEFDPDPDHRPLFGRHVLVTAGPTHEPIDPVRYIANRSSGKQGFAIAAMAAAAGARVTLVAGPVHLPTPLGVDRIDVESAEEMASAVENALPADAAFMVAAVADWKARMPAGQKLKKADTRPPPALELAENPDILATLARAENRPALLIGFAAETESVVDNALAKRARKGADWIVANDVADNGQGSVMGGDRNRVHIVTEAGVETLDEMPKEDVARELVRRAAQALENEHD